MEVSDINTSQSVLCREIIAVCSEIHTERINTLCGLNVELVNVKRGGACCNQWAANFKLLRLSCRCGGSANRLSQTSLSGDSPFQYGLLG